MANILINKNDLPRLIENYTEENKTFRIMDCTPKKGNPNGFAYRFFLNGKECKMDVYYKEKTTKIMPIGSNIDTTNILIDYIKTKSLNPNVENKQLVFNTTENFCEEIKEYFKIFYPQFAMIEECGNKYTFVGYNQDRVYLNQYPDKIMIQGKPLVIFGLIINYIAENTDISVDEFYTSISDSVAQPFNVIRNVMQNMLGDAYIYIDEAIKKTLSSSIVMLEQNKSVLLEDFSGCVTGAFKTLEGYLKKVLDQKFGYRFNKGASFELFDGQSMTIKKGYIICTPEQANALCALYRLFKNKRNSYLHAKTNPALTAVIPSYMDAKSIFDEIVNTIKKSYAVIFGE